MNIISFVLLCATIRFVCEAKRRQGGTLLSTKSVENGTLYKRGDYPWIVALMHTGANPPKYICGGTLISLRHVITAAHCIEDKFSEKINHDDIVAVFGAYNLSNVYEYGRLALTPEKIFIHDQWDNQVERYDADIAILEFAPNVITLSEFVKPTKLWNSAFMPTKTKGKVIGWGVHDIYYDTHQVLLIQKLQKVKMYPMNKKCYAPEVDESGVTSWRLFCAEVTDGKDLCRGESGNGFIIKSGGLYYLRGIASSTRLLSDTGTCDKNALYTDVLYFKSWINGIVKDALSVKPLSDIFHFPPDLDQVQCGVSEFKPKSRMKRIVSPIGAVSRGQFPW